MASLTYEMGADKELYQTIQKMKPYEKDELCEKVRKYNRSIEPVYNPDYASGEDFTNVTKPTEMEFKIYDALVKAKYPAVKEAASRVAKTREGGKRKSRRTKQRKLKRKSNRRK
jgi:hypothetical protein